MHVPYCGRKQKKMTRQLKLGQGEEKEEEGPTHKQSEWYEILLERGDTEVKSMWGVCV